MSNNSACEGGGFAGTPLSPDAAARLVSNICEITQQRLPKVRCTATNLTRIYDMGADVYEDASYTVPFESAIEQFVEQKIDLRPASYREYKNVLGRMLRLSPAYKTRSVRSLRTRDCLELMTRTYRTAHTLDKARRLLHCFFAYALQQNWCRENPVARVQVFRKTEEMVSTLSMAQICRLLETCATLEHCACAPAVGLMLWGGMRPTEVTRLRWSEVDLEDSVVRVLPRVSKTGGARLITILPILRRWLERFRPGNEPDAPVAPANWIRRWYALRQAAGLTPWRADALRHTFASYHLRYFKDIHRLQLEMGHSTARLLFNRYLNLGNITTAAAAAFWELPLPKRPRLPKPRTRAEKRAADRNKRRGKSSCDDS